ncbi:glycoside hydrolase family 130 protein [Pelagicoccus sp. SDUM812005]|uniref:glycoside hydrolase family 130 protein n=1 Tax=Pelagicoccus sp. SDUM812005 TaxID=3041257 RepID=UPI00280D5A59|nr:glycoside hydrolase family 130 protein [Pelagicoccus sp. SDUM812005]MDQ8182502.1 glycoside hydrolase family 130 protein [Pelagicoccus sp. SDUM812005]
MSKTSNTPTLIGPALPHIPWENKPAGCTAPLWRFSQNPIIGWNPIPSGARAYNSAVVPYGDAFVGVFRVDDKSGRAGLHFGTSPDAINWDLEDRRIDWVDENGKPNPNSYAYDPRVVLIEDTYYITWCDDMKGASIGLGYTKDFKTFVKAENPLMPFNRNGVLFPRKIGGEYVLLSRPSDSAHTPFGDIYLSQSPDLTYWGKHRHVMSAGGSGWWQGTKIGAGPIPIETTEGWLLFYHGVSGTCNGFVYSIGAALLDLEDPSTVLYRSRGYLLTPEKSYETTGFVPNVAFPCATLCDGPSGRIAIYYGAADTYSAIAFTQVDELIEFIKSDSEV